MSFTLALQSIRSQMMILGIILISVLSIGIMWRRGALVA